MKPEESRDQHLNFSVETAKFYLRAEWLNVDICMLVNLHCEPFLYCYFSPRICISFIQSVIRCIALVVCYVCIYFGTEGVVYIFALIRSIASLACTCTTHIA